MTFLPKNRRFCFLQTVVILSALLTFPFAVWAQTAPQLKLADNGASDYIIALPSQPTPVEQTAAKELQKYFGEITGAVLPIVAQNEVKTGDSTANAKILWVGKTAKAQSVVDFATFKQDEIFLKSFPDGSLILAGHDQRGTLYAVYTLLEDFLGVRWWTQTESFVPKNPTIALDPISVRYAPKLIYRESFYRVGFQGEFAAHSKTNGASEAISDEFGGHNRYQFFVHSFSWLIPAEKYYREHPDWFPEIDGVRKCGFPNWASAPESLREFQKSLKPEQIHTSGVQLCLANDEMRKELTKNALEALRSNPKTNIISISQNDWHGYCTCPKCRALDEAEGSPAGSLITFVNKVAEDIEKEFPNVWVDTLAYQYTRKPPKTVKPRHNVIVRLCTIECSFLKPLTDEVNKTLKDDIEGWSAIAPQLFVWDYVTNFSYYLMPHPNIQVLAPNIRFFVKNKTIGLFEQGDYHSTVGDFVDARHWVIAKSLWNPELDEKKLWTEFLNNYYGPAAGPILQEYLDYMGAQGLKSNVYLSCFMQNTNKWLDAHAMNESSKIVERARKAVENDPVLKKRVDVALLSYDLNWLMRYNELKLFAQLSGEKFMGPQDPIAKANELFALSESKNSFHFREHCPRADWDKFKTDLLYQLRVSAAKKPDLKLDWNKTVWIDIQDAQIGVCGQEKGWGGKIEDPAASDGRAIQMPGNHFEWATSWHLPVDINKFVKKWRVYAAVRCEATAQDGPALQWGIYDLKNKKGVAGRNLTVQEINGSEYKLIDYGCYDNLTSDMYMWYAPTKRPDEVQKVYIDRIILVAE